MNFFFFILISCFFMCLIVSSFNLFFLFLSLEGLTLSSIVIICLIDYKLKSLETILNYFFISAVSSVFFILGMTIIFLDNNLSFCFSSFRIGLENKIKLNNYLDFFSNIEFLILIGILFIFLFFFIKLGFFPFHFWVPKFFNSIWFLIVFFLVLIKLVFISIFFRIIGFFCFFSIHNFFLIIFYICSIGSIIIGCIGAFYCNNLKYFIAFTSINNLGYLFMGFSTNNFIAAYFSFLFFLIYFFNFIIFFISLIFIKYFENFNKNIFLNGIYFTKLNNFIKYNKNIFLNFIILFSFFSISGLPPFAIFSIKIDLLNQVWLNGNYLMVLISLITSFFSIFYYFRLLKFLIKEK